MQLYDRFSGEGFVVLGVCQNLNARALRDLLGRRARIAWPQVPREEAGAFLKELGLHGEASNLLLDRDGRIIGRNLYGSDLAAAVRAAINRP